MWGNYAEFAFDWICRMSDSNVNWSLSLSLFLSLRSTLSEITCCSHCNNVTHSFARLSVESVHQIECLCQCSTTNTDVLHSIPHIFLSLSRCTGTIRLYNDIKNDAQWKIVHGNGGPEDSDNQDVQKLPPIRQTSNLDGLTSIYTITIKHNRISCANDCANKAIIPAGSTGAYGCYIDHNIIALCA